VRGTSPSDRCALNARVGSACERPRAAGMKHGRTCRDLRRYSDHDGRLLGWWGTRSSLRRKPKQRNFGSDVPGNVGLSVLANPGAPQTHRFSGCIASQGAPDEDRPLCAGEEHHRCVTTV
jgi:hypothetical protein